MSWSSQSSYSISQKQTKTTPSNRFNSTNQPIRTNQAIKKYWKKIRNVFISLSYHIDPILRSSFSFNSLEEKTRSRRNETQWVGSRRIWLGGRCLCEFESYFFFFDGEKESGGWIEFELERKMITRSKQKLFLKDLAPSQSFSLPFFSFVLFFKKFIFNLLRKMRLREAYIYEKAKL